MNFTALAGEDELDLRCLVDYSSVECFAMAGRAVVSLPVVPDCTEAGFKTDGGVQGQS
jgi:hypothetical protein